MGECTLCGLATPTPPHTTGDVSGEYCCVGCLTVARTLDERPEDADLDDRLDTGPATADVDGSETYLDVSGMHCATCEQFLESTATDVAGVRAAEASYTSGMMQVVYDPDRTGSAAVAEGVSTYGYDARERTDTSEDDDQQAVGRLLVGGFFGMMTMMWYVLFLYPVYLGVGPAGGPADPSAPARPT